ncbi:MAG: hypothetical protein QM811_16910 [Pirellulales bacterium]
MPGVYEIDESEDITIDKEKGDDASRTWETFDCPTDAIAEAMVAAVAPSTWRGLYRGSFKVRAKGSGIWQVAVSYVPRKPREDYEFEFRFDIGTESTRITHSLAVRNSYFDPFWLASAPNHNGAIGYDGKEIKGLNILVPKCTISYKVKLPADFVTDSYKRTLSKTVGKVNSATWKNYAAGELLFTSCTGSVTGTDKDWDVTFGFTVSENVTGLTVGNISGITKRGWDYLDVLWESTLDLGSERVTPIAAYVHKVYQDAAYSAPGVLMPNPYDKVDEGQPLSISATAWNGMTGLLASTRNAKKATVAPPAVLPREWGLAIPVDPAGAIDDRSPVAIGTPTQSDESSLAFRMRLNARKSVYYAPNTNESYTEIQRTGHTTLKCATHREGSATLEGVIHAKINIIDANAHCAEPYSDGSDVLRYRSCPDGPHLILWKEHSASTGDMLCVLHLGAAIPRVVFAKATTNWKQTGGAAPSRGGGMAYVDCNLAVHNVPGGSALWSTETIRVWLPTGVKDPNIQANQRFPVQRLYHAYGTNRGIANVGGSDFVSYHDMSDGYIGQLEMVAAPFGWSPRGLGAARRLAGHDQDVVRNRRRLARSVLAQQPIHRQRHRLSSRSRHRHRSLRRRRHRTRRQFRLKEQGMAEEITINASLEVLNGLFKLPKIGGVVKIDQAAIGGGGPGVVTAVTTSNGTELVVTNYVSTPGLCLILNLSGANYVDVGAEGTSGVAYPIRVKPGEPAVFRIGTLGSNKLYLKANGSSAKVLVVILEN